MTCQYCQKKEWSSCTWYECKMLNLLGITYFEVKEDCDPKTCGLAKLLKACHKQRDRASKLATENTNLWFDLRLVQRQVEQLEDRLRIADARKGALRVQSRLISKLLRACHKQRDRAREAENECEEWHSSYPTE